MSFLDELQRRRSAYAERRERVREELRRLDQIVAGLDAMVADEHGIEAAPEQPDGAAPTEHGPGQSDASGGSFGQPIGAAIDRAMLQADAPLSFAEIRRCVETAFPPVHVRNLDSSLSSALNYGVNAGKYERVARGLYRMPPARDAQAGTGAG